MMANPAKMKTLLVVLPDRSANATLSLSRGDHSRSRRRRRITPALAFPCASAAAEPAAAAPVVCFEFAT